MALEPPPSPAIEALVLAAGSSSRMAPRNKLTLEGADGRSLIARVVDALQASPVRGIHVVVGHEADAVMRAIGPAEVSIVVCDDYRLGLSASLKTGLRHLSASLDAVLVCLGDMPLLSPALIRAVIGTWRPGYSVVPSHDGVRGHPVLWDRDRIGEMLELTGDQGARSLLDAEPARVIELAMADAACLRDADTREALRALPGGPWRTPAGRPI